MKYWINTISKDHVLRGIAGGFTQSNHGKPHLLKRLQKSDWVIFYSPKLTYEGNEPLQSFTAIGQVSDEEIYQVKMSENFEPFRRKLQFEECREVPIRPLIERLSFIEDKIHWGYKFRFGLFEIPKEDFQLISTGMFRK